MDQEQEVEAQEQQNVPEEQEVEAQQIEDGIKEHLKKPDIPKLDRILKAGTELLFGKDSHYKMLDGLESSQDVSGDLGKGAFGMALMLLKQSGNTLPGELLIPAGVILLARLVEFMNSEGSGMPQVSGDDYEQAVHVFTTLTMDKLDPEFKNKLQSQGQPLLNQEVQ